MSEGPSASPNFSSLLSATTIANTSAPVDSFFVLFPSSSTSPSITITTSSIIPSSPSSTSQTFPSAVAYVSVNTASLPPPSQSTPSTVDPIPSKDFIYTASQNTIETFALSAQANSITVPGQIGSPSRVFASTPSSIGALTQGGALATYTQPGIALSRSSFFDNHGAVAGTFVVIAIFSVAIFACLCLVWRRRLRQRKHLSVLETATMLSDGRGDWEFQRGLYEGHAISIISDDTISLKPAYRTDALFHGIGIMTERGDTVNNVDPAYRAPLDHVATGLTSRGLMGRVIAENPRMDSPTPSPAPSTPSIYPPSLPLEETESDITKVYPSPFSTPSMDPPPRPPRRRPSPHSLFITRPLQRVPV